MMRDLVSRLAEAQAIGPATLSATNTPGTLDLAGFQSAVVMISVGAGGITFDTSNKIEFIVTHSDDDSTYTAVADADIQGVSGTTSGIVRSLTAAKAAADTAPTEIGYVGNKRYLKVQAKFSGTHGTGTPISVVLVKGNGAVKPS